MKTSCAIKFGDSTRLRSAHRLRFEVDAAGLIKMTLHEAGPSRATVRQAGGYLGARELRAIATAMQQIADVAEQPQPEEVEA